MYSELYFLLKIGLKITIFCLFVITGIKLRYISKTKIAIIKSKFLSNNNFGFSRN